MSTQHVLGKRSVSELDTGMSLLHQDFHFILQAEASLLGYAVKLGPHEATESTLVLSDVTVSIAVNKEKNLNGGAKGLDPLVASRVPLCPPTAP